MQYVACSCQEWAAAMLFEHILHPHAHTKAGGDDDDQERDPGSMGVAVKAEAKTIRVKRPRVNDDA